jgi:hypothetical protein
MLIKNKIIYFTSFWDFNKNFEFIYQENIIYPVLNKPPDEQYWLLSKRKKNVIQPICVLSGDSLRKKERIEEEP